MSNVPSYWKSSLEDVEETLKYLKKGKIVSRAMSAGGRELSLIIYGEKNELRRTANLSSALGASDRKCYADKSGEDYRPTLLLVGCVHGGEFEGVVALNNLIKLLETGTDFKGEGNEFLKDVVQRVNLLIIPCLNPDGRARIDFPSFVRKTFDDLRYYNQGTWKDGTLCGYPGCKKIHPIKDSCDFLGAYFNDDGINLMHDDFFGKKSPENEFLFSVVDEYVPDFTILLHGGDNTPNLIFKPTYSPTRVKEGIAELDNAMKTRCDAESIRYYVTGMDRGEENEIPGSFNLTSALYHHCGEPVVTYESNQGLVPWVEHKKPMTHDEIYRCHIILFEEAIKHIEKKEGKYE